MDLKEKLVSSHLALPDRDFENPYWDARRGAAIKRFDEQGFPNRKAEDWKYTNLRPYLQEDYKIFYQTEQALDYRDVKKYFIHDIDSYKLVFIDGVYSSWLSETTHDRFDVCVLSSALSQAKYAAIIEGYLDKSPQHAESLRALNTAFAREGAFIHIPEGQVVDKPIQILHFTSGIDTAVWAQPRNLVVAGKNAGVQIIERHQNIARNKVLTNAVTEVFTAERAAVDYYKLQYDSPLSTLIDHTVITQAAESRCRVNTFSFGGDLTRNDLNFYHRGPHCESQLYGITLIGEKQTTDHHTLVSHAAPNCQSDELYKGIFADAAHGVFNGKVIVDPNAQKTNAFQRNNNVLLSDQARIDTKPQLEIFADDVKCSHGCTVGQLDEEALFYLRSRGIPKREARALLLFAFTHEVLAHIGIPELKIRVNAWIAKKLGVSLEFDL